MVKNPYNITLSSTKKNLFMIFLVIIYIVVGFIFGSEKGFGQVYTMSSYDEYEQSGIVDGFSGRTDLYTINFIYALVGILIALGIIIIRHDVIGVISGIIMFGFIFFVLVVGASFRSGGIANIHEEEKVTLLTMLVKK